MEALLSSVCVTLVVLAFCQILVEAVLPDGSLKRYVTFLTGVITVLVVLGLFVRPQIDLPAELTQGLAATQTGQIEPIAPPGGNPYEEYLRKLIDDHR